MKKALQEFGLTPENSTVIGSGILEALDIRKGKDIDVVTTKKIFDILKKSGKFTSLENHGQEIIANDKFEIGVAWNVLGRMYLLEDLIKESIVVRNIRYVTLDFLYKVKKSWVENDENPRQKDIDDLKLIEEYRKSDN